MMEEEKNDKTSKKKSVSSQIAIIYCTSFCTIGSFNALQNLGGAGEQKPYVANFATSINFILLGLFCFFGGPLVNKFGLRLILSLGTLGDPIFAIALLISVKFQIQSFLIVAAIIRGALSGLFWAAEGFVINAYPKPSHRLSIITGWVAAKELGSLIASSINLGISIKDDHEGAVSDTVYYVTIAIMCFAFPISLFLSPTKQIYHKDGQPVDNEMVVKTNLKSEYKALKKQLFTKEVLLMVPLACYAYFYYSSMHTYVGKYFTVRSRALLAFCTSLSAILGSATVTIFCDFRSGSKMVHKRLFSTILILFIGLASWSYFGWSLFAIQKHKKSSIDWRHPSPSTFLQFAFSPLLLSFSMQAVESYLYWTATSFCTSIKQIAILTAIVRGIESLAQSVAYGINSVPHASPIVIISINVSLLFLGGISMLFLTFTTKK